MEDEIENTTTVTTETPPDNGGEKTFTQSELDRIVQERLDRNDRKWQSRIGKEKPEPRLSAKGDAAQDEKPAYIVELEAKLSVSEAFQGHKLTHKQKQLLTREFISSAPDDVDAWAEEMAGVIGLGKHQTIEEAQPKPKPPANNPGSPPATQVTDDTPLWQMSPSDRASLIARKGTRWYRDTLRKQLSGARVVLRNQ